jgi:sugar fermentation stimulation protein A
VRIPLPTLEGRFLRRYKRFFADVELDDGRIVTAHCPNTGSLLGCLAEGRRAVLRDSQNDARKLRYVFQAIRVGRFLVNVDTGLPNAALFDAVSRGLVPELAGYDAVRREVAYGRNSRIDLLLERAGGSRCYVEVKNTTYAVGRAAAFPDAVTERGLKHLGELARMVRAGHRAVQFFFVSRSGVDRFRPADEIDPEYGKALRKAARAGVEVLAYSTRVRRDSIQLARRLEVVL